MMCRIIQNSLFILFAGWMSTYPVTAQDQPSDPVDPPAFSISITTERAEQTDVHAGDHFQWELQVRWHGNRQSINPEIERQPDLQGLEVVKSATILRTGAHDEGVYSEKVFQYTFRATEEGSASIGTAAISYQTSPDETPITLQTTPKTITIHPERFSAAKWLTSMWETMWVRITVIALLILLVIVTCVLWFRSSKTEEPVGDEEQVDPVDAALQQAKSQRIEGDYQGYFAGLEQAVRLRLNLVFPDVTSTGLHGYKNALPPEIQTAFERFITESEEAKYAPVAPSSETLDRVWDDVKRIVRIEK